MPAPPPGKFVIQVYVDEAMKQRLETVAKNEQRPVSNMARLLIDQALTEREAKIPAGAN